MHPPYARLTPNESASLIAFALAHGADWRDALRDLWMAAEIWDGEVYGVPDPGRLLYCLRNTHGPTWLYDVYRPAPRVIEPAAGDYTAEIGEAFEAQASAQGFATYNHVPTVLVDVPDETYTISARTSDGRRITFAFLQYKTDGAPQCVDVQYHDDGPTWRNGGSEVPTFDLLVFAGGRTPYDSRTAVPGAEANPDLARKPTAVCVLMLDAENKAKAEAEKRRSTAQRAGYTVLPTDGGRWAYNAPDGGACGVGFASVGEAWDAAAAHLIEAGKGA